jgi:copper chaperone
MKTNKTTLRVEGMSCPSCVSHVRDALAIEGVTAVDVRLREGTVVVAHDDRVAGHRLVAELADAGYEARDATGHV